MPEHDFLYALHDDVPEDFATQLKQQLEVQDQQQIVEKSQHHTWWTVAVASIITLIVSVGILVNNSGSLPFMKALLLQPDLSNHGVIADNNLNQLQLIERIGKHFYDFEPYANHVIIAADDGIYEHDATNLNAQPRLLVDASATDLTVDGTGNIFFQHFDATREHVIVYRWDRETGEIRQLQTLDSTYIISPDSLFVSEDGQRYYITSCVGDFPTAVRFYDCGWHIAGFDVASGENFANHDLLSYVAKVAQSGDKKWLVYFKYDLPETNLYLNRIEMNTGETTTLFKLPYNADYQQWITAATHLAISDDGQTILTGNPSTSDVNLWDVPTLLKRIDMPHVFLGKSDLSFSARESSGFVFDLTGKFLLQSGTWNWRIYDISGNVTVQTVPIHTNQFETMVYSDDGSIAFGMQYGILYAYDTDTWEEREVLTRYANSGDIITFTADGNTLITNQTPMMWDLSSGEPTSQVLMNQEKQVRPMRHAVISPDGQYIAYQTYDLREWVESGGVYVKNLSTDTTYAVGKLVVPMIHMEFLSDNTLLVVSDAGYIYQIPPEKLDVEEKEPYSIIHINDVSIKNNIELNTADIAFTPDGKHAAIWDCAEYNPQSRQCDRIRSLQLWDIANEELIGEITNDNFKQPGQITFSSDGEQFAYSYCTNGGYMNEYVYECLSSEVIVWHVGQLMSDKKFGPLRVFKTNGMTALAFHPMQQADGSYLLAMTIVADDGETQFWRISPDGDNEMIYRSPDIKTPIFFSPKGDWIVTRWLDVWSVPPN